MGIPQNLHFFCIFCVPALKDYLGKTMEKQRADPAFQPFPQISRKGHYAEKVVFVDGLWGCGKTMMSPIISAFERVELLAYSYEIEQLCSLYSLGKISDDAIVTMIKLLVDVKLYDTMMSREVNFRYSDLSSIFKDAHPLRYIRRLFQKGDEFVPDRIAKERPILHLTTHQMLAYSRPIFEALGERAVFIEVVRHPLYMVKQIDLNMQKLIGTLRDFTIYYSLKGTEFPYFMHGWEDQYSKANPTERAVLYIYHMTKLTNLRRASLNQEYQKQIVTIPFEIFVVQPDEYIPKIEMALGSRCTNLTRKVMKKQKVPRQIFADGIGLKIYQRCGWEPPKSNSNSSESELRRQYVAERVSLPILKMMDELIEAYEADYMSQPLPQLKKKAS